MQSHYFAGNRETEPHSFVLSRIRGVLLLEGLEDARQRERFNPFTRVRHLHYSEPVPIAPRLDAGRHFYCTPVGELQRVADDVEEDLCYIFLTPS